MVVGEREDLFAGVGGADAEVVHAAGAAEGHAAFGVEAVVAQAVVAGGVPVGRGEGFGGRLVGLSGGLAVKSAVGALLVVDVDEAVDVGLEVGDGGGVGFLPEPFFEGDVVALYFSLGLGW